MEYLRLNECAAFSDKRTKNILLESYISTENMIPNKGGICTAESIPDSISASKYEPQDILLSNIRPYFRKIWYADREGSCSNDVLVLKAQKGIDSKFLYYVLSDNNFFNYDTVTSKGTKMPRGSKKAIMKYLVPNYDLPTQRRITSILSAYDNLIENNNRRIRLLEQMAENLYKEWFVRFRFPGHEKEVYANSKLGKLPSSFRVTNMGEIFADYIGGGWGNDELSEDYPVEASVIRGADFPKVWHYDVSSCPRRYHKTSNYMSRQLQDGDIVMEISGGTSEQPVGRRVLVTQDMINRFKDGKVICASFCKMIRLKKEILSPYFFYYWMHYLYDTRIIDRFQLQSTGIINFKFESFLRKGDVIIPPKELQESFDSKVIPIIKEINHLAIQIENLSRQRDLLLPRLMSGKLEVKT